jgi:hypothetical protein
MNKNKILIIISVALAIIIASIVLFFIQHSQKKDLGQALLKTMGATFSDKVLEVATSSEKTQQIATSSPWTYRNEENGFEIKMPYSFEKYIDYGNGLGRFHRIFLGNSVNGTSTMVIKINLFSELTPLLPSDSSGDSIVSTTKINLFKGKVKETIVSTQGGKETSVFVSFCLNKKLDLSDSKPDYKASEATIYCQQDYNLYDFNLFCVGEDSKNCKSTFDKILSSFKIF